MSYAIDPIRSLRRRIAGIGLAGLCAVAACAVWALRTPAVSAPWDERLKLDLAPPQSLPASETNEQRPAFDPNLFAVKLWHPPPPPPPPEPQQQRVVERGTPLNLQLIGIVHEGQERRAVLYDPQSDRLYIIAPTRGDFGGDERIGQHTVTAVTDTYVELTNGRSVKRLELIQAGGPGS